MATNYSDEQLLRFKQAGFSAEEISLFMHNPAYAPTEEELEALLLTTSITNTLNVLPANLDELFEQIELTYGVILEENLPVAELAKRVELLEKQNPTLAKQVSALFAISEHAGLFDEEQ